MATQEKVSAQSGAHPGKGAHSAHGARQIFGIPGDFSLPYFRIIEESQILPLYTLSHEPGVGFAADAAARIAGGLGVAAVTYGAGALNMVNAVAAAFAEKSPLVVLSGGPGQGESHSGLLLHHQAKTLDSQYQIYKEITCDQTRLDDAKQAPAEIARVLASCLRLSQPVYIEMASGMGGEGVRVQTRAELQAALAQAFAKRGRFQLIDITIPRGVLSQTLARFVAGVKRINAPA